jgi:hypothetical protein
MEPGKRLFVSMATTAFFLAVLLISAGRFRYWQGWAFAGISLIMNIAMQLTVDLLG